VDSDTEAKVNIRETSIVRIRRLKKDKGKEKDEAEQGNNEKDNASSSTSHHVIEIENTDHSSLPALERLQMSQEGAAVGDTTPDNALEENSAIDEENPETSEGGDDDDTAFSYEATISPSMKALTATLD